MFARLTSDDWKAALQVRTLSVLQRGRVLAKGTVAFCWRYAIDWIRELRRWAVWSVRRARDWWQESLAAVAPFALLAILVRGPEIPAVLRSEASIGTVAAVQGAVTGLSLITLVLAVELARRQEDRDDTAYEIMLHSAWIRPTFAFALAALLATAGAAAIADFSVFADETRAANLLLCAYLLTGSVVSALLATVLRTVHVLRPTGITGYRFRANDRERQRKVAEFISKSLNEFPTLGPIERLLLPHTPVGLTATERLFAEMDDAFQSGQAARFSGALQRLRALIENSADQIAESNLGFQPPGRPRLGYWFPLDALEGRLGELWRSALARQGREFELEMWSLEYWLLITATRRRSGELLEVALRSGLIGYQVSKEVGQSSDHARHEWINLGSPAWWQEPGVHGVEATPTSELFVRRFIEYLQEYGNMLLGAGDADSFRNMLAQFRQAYFDAAEDRWMYQLPTVDRNVPLSTFEYGVMALLALAGRAITLREQGKLGEVRQYLAPINELIDQVASIERYVPTAHEPETALHQQWGWWEIEGKGDGGVSFAWVAPEHYPMLPLLLRLLMSDSDEPLPALGGFAQRFIDAWTSHKEVLLEVVRIDTEDEDELASRFERRLQTAREAEDREREDFHMAAPLDNGRVAQFLERITAERLSDRVLEGSFEQVGRVHHLDEGDWATEVRLAHAWRLPRSPFIDDPSFLPLQGTGLVRGFELALGAQLVEMIADTSQVISSVEMELDDILAAVESATLAVGQGPKLIVLAGDWPNDLSAKLRLRMFSETGADFSPSQRDTAFVLGVYKGNDMLRMSSRGEPVIVVLALDRWGWLSRAPKDGEDFKVNLMEIDSDEAKLMASAELPDDADEETIAAKVRELRLLVRLQAEERARFEVEDSDGARIIRVVSNDDENQGGS